ncbi:uncharacterized protein RHO25_006695 [Cercospora beticola]|uniref:Uncharacterized protein n=1 Tax=Cercospora beticola TaxID=122368 RepID=A0ABZ0NRE8_CERBT|nr:hypothetical protein RHO25_006695 [Cercospora beticola]
MVFRFASNQHSAYGHYKRELDEIDAVLDAVYALKEKREATKYEHYGKYGKYGNYGKYPELEHYACKLERKCFEETFPNNAAAYGHYAREANAAPEAAPEPEAES